MSRIITNLVDANTAPDPAHALIRIYNTRIRELLILRETRNSKKDDADAYTKTCAALR